MNNQSDIQPERGSYQRSDEARSIVSKRVCDCPEPCACDAEAYAQGKDRAFFEMSNSTGPGTRGAAGVSRIAPSARSWRGMLDHMATSEDQEGRLVAFHFLVERQPGE